MEAEQAPTAEPARPYPSWLVGGAVPRLRWDDPALERYLRSAEPVVITGGCPFTAPLVGRWTFERLAAHYQGKELMTHFAPRTTTRFNRFYGRGLGKGGCVRQPFGGFVAIGAANEALTKPAWRFYMQAMVLSGARAEAPGAGAPAGGELDVPERVSKTRAVSHAPLDAPLLAELQAMDFGWLESALAAAESDGFHSCTLWAGYGGGSTPMHYDAVSNFFTQLVGRKRILVFEPGEWVNLYPFPSSHPMDSYVMADVEAPDLQKYPALARARGLECTLEPGDVLWLPSYYWHYVRQLDEGEQNLSLNCWVGTSGHRCDLGVASYVSTFLGGRAREMGEAQAARAVPKATVETLSACSAASAVAAALPASKAAALVAADASLLAPIHGLQHLFAARILESKAAAGLGAGETDPDGKVGPFLNALAAGADSALGRVHAERARARGEDVPPPAIGDPGSQTHSLATDMRWALVCQFGAPVTCALLRACTRHGRLHPGPPPIGEPADVVNSEEKETTPPAEVARMLASGADGAYCDSKFLLDEDSVSLQALSLAD